MVGIKVDLFMVKLLVIEKCSCVVRLYPMLLRPGVHISGLVGQPKFFPTSIIDARLFTLKAYRALSTEINYLHAR